MLGPSSVGTPSSSRGGLRREAGREYEFTATNPQKQVSITNQRNLKFGLLVELQKLEEDDSRKDAKHAKFGEV